MDRKKGQCYNSKYGTEFDFITKSGKSKQHAFCTICRRDISIAHGGRSDIVLHRKSKLHIGNFESESSSTPKITSWMSTSQDLNVTRAECLFTSFYLEHNIPLSAASHMGPLLRKAFPNSEEVKKFSSARTKTSCLKCSKKRLRLHQRVSRTPELPGPLSGPWTPAARTSRTFLCFLSDHY